MGKGSRRRAAQVSRETVNRNWELAFSMPEEWQTSFEVSNTIFAYNRSNPKKKDEKNV